MKIVKGLITSYVISTVLLLVLSLVLFKFSPAEGVMQGLVFFTYWISTFAGGLIVGNKSQNRKFLWGLLTGVIYFAFLMLLSFLLKGQAFAGTTNPFLAALLSALGGMMGGMAAK
ncbi:TIGR04086 family membrane protein [Anaerolentibacter hominis]|uniref:TIGR04086 family membrane protein n=1 Tax=Anaerolentibacter hominis TaxID=3079009 RepID=UPI0031B83302